MSEHKQEIESWKNVRKESSETHQSPANQQSSNYLVKGICWKSFYKAFVAKTDQSFKRPSYLLWISGFGVF